MVDQQVTFQQFLTEQRKTNQLLEKQIIDDQRGDNLVVSAKNAAAEIGNTIIQERKNRKEHDETQEAVRTSVKEVEKAIVDQGTTTSKQQQQVILSQNKAQKQRDRDYDEFLKTSEIEKKILKQTDKQYEATLIQRARVEESKQILEGLRKSIQGDVEKNREYQKADMTLKKQQLKLDKLERRRGLLDRFKDDEGKTTFKSVGKEIKASGKRIFDVFGKLKALFGAFLVGLFVLFTQSELFEDLRQFVKDFLKNVDSFGELGLKLAGVAAALYGATKLLKSLPGSIATTLGIKPKPAPKPPTPTTPGGKVQTAVKPTVTGTTTKSSASTPQNKGPNVSQNQTSSASSQGKNANLNNTGQKGILARTAALTTKFPAIGRILKFLPFLGPIIGGLEFYDIMTSDASPKEKSKRGAALFAGTALGLKGAAVGAMIGGPVGAALGGVAGYLLGDKLGEYTMGVIFGESLEDQIKNDIDRVKKFFTGEDDPTTIEGFQKRIATNEKRLKSGRRIRNKGGIRRRIQQDKEAIQKLREEQGLTGEPEKASKMSEMSSRKSTAPINAVAVNSPTINQAPTNETIVSSNISEIPLGTTGLLTRGVGSMSQSAFS